MSARTLLPIIVLLAAVSIRCGGSPSAPAGTVSVTVTTTTTTTTVIPALGAGAVSASPAGIGLVSATVYTFGFATPPSGGVPPYTYAWTFGDGEEGSGAAPAHVYANTGGFTASVTVTDSKGTAARASTTVVARSVTGHWTATFEGTGPQPEPIDLLQNQAAVSATINDTANALGFGSGSGNVSNPRSLSISATFGAGTPAAVGVTFVGRIDDTLTTWTGTATGYKGCPCTFTATRPEIAASGPVRR
jgi:PKD repeat protein